MERSLRSARRAAARRLLASLFTAAIALVAAAPAGASVRGCLTDAFGNPLRRVYVESQGIFHETDIDGCVTVSASSGATQVGVKVWAKNPVVKMYSGSGLFPVEIGVDLQMKEGRVSALPDKGNFFDIAEEFRTIYDNGLREFSPWSGSSFPTQPDPPSPEQRKSREWISVIWPAGAGTTSWVEPADEFAPHFPLLQLKERSYGTQAHELGHALHFAALSEARRWDAKAQYLVSWLLAESLAGRDPSHMFEKRTNPLVAYIEAFGCFAEVYEATSSLTKKDGAARHGLFFEQIRQALASPVEPGQLTIDVATDGSIQPPEAMCTGDFHRGVQGDDVEGAVFLMLFYEWAQRVGLELVVDRYVTCESLDVHELASCVRDEFGAHSSVYAALVAAGVEWGVELPPATAPIAGSPEKDDRFGTTVATGDFDGDGFEDLAIGVPDEAIGSVAKAGMLHVLYGSPAGLLRETEQAFDESQPGMPGQGALPTASGESSAQGGAKAGDRFGAALAVGDFDVDGFDDLAIGAPGEDVFGARDAGHVVILYGSGAGLGAEVAVSWVRDPESGAGFGSALAVGNFNHDERDDLAVGAPGAAVGSLAEAGEVHVLFGGLVRLGFQARSPLAFSQDTTGVWELAEAGDRFGAALAAGDFDGSPGDDLAIGAPGEALPGSLVLPDGSRMKGTLLGAGAVNVLYGSESAGLVGTNRGFTQADLGDTVEAFDAFGSVLAAADLNADGLSDLVIGVPSEDLGLLGDVGLVHHVRGGSWALTPTTYLLTDSGDREPGDRFGASLAVADFDGLGGVDLAVATPGEDLGASLADSGRVLILPNGRLPTTGSPSARLPAVAQAEQRAGAALASGDFDGDGDGAVQLVIGVPERDVSGKADAGAVDVLFTIEAPTQIWHQDR